MARIGRGIPSRPQLVNAHPYQASVGTPSSADTGSGAEGTPTIVVNVSSSDTGSGAEGTPTILATLSSADTGSGSEANSIPGTQISRIWSASSAATDAGSTSATISLSGATDGEWIFVFFCQTGSIGASSLGISTNGSGSFTTIQSQTPMGGTNTGNVGIWCIKKTSSDTTLTISWTTSRQYIWFAQQYANLDPTTPYENYSGTSVTTANNVFTAPSITPTLGNRWGVFFTGDSDGNLNQNAVSWTPSSPLSEIVNVRQNTWIHPVAELCDTTDTVPPIAQAFSSTFTPSGVAVSNGFVSALYLIPTSAITKSGSDTGTASEGTPTILASLSDSDTASGAEGTPSIALSSSDTASGVEGTPSIAVPVSGADTGSGADAVSGIALNSAETGSGAESASYVSTTSTTETGSGADAVSSIGLNSADTGSGANAVSGIALNATETGSGAEGTPTILGTLGTTETGSGADSNSPIGISSSDTGSGTEGSTPTILASVSDSDVNQQFLEIESLPSFVGIRGTSSYNNTGAANVQLQVPTGTVAGDLLVAIVGDSFSGSASTSAATGWTQLDATSINSATLAAGVYYKTATSTDASTNPTYSFPIGGTHKAIGIMAAFFGMDPNNPFNVENSGTTTTTSTSQTFPSISPTAPNNLTVGFGVFRNNANGLTNNSLTVPSGWTKQADVQTTASSSNNAEATMMTQQQVNPANPSSLTGTLHNSSTGIMFTLTLTPKPLTDSGSGDDEPSQIGLNAADTGSGAEGTPTILRAATTADTGSGVEAWALTQSVSSSDTGTGTEGTPSIIPALSSADTGSGADAVSVIGVSAAETGSGAESASSTAAVSAADTGTDSESGFPTIPISSSDTGSGADTNLAIVNAVSGSDTGSGAEAVSSILGTLSGSDSASGAEGWALTQSRSGSDTASGAEAVSNIGLNASDNVAGTDTNSNFTVAVSDSDANGITTEVGTLPAQIMVDGTSNYTNTGASFVHLQVPLGTQTGDLLLALVGDVFSGSASTSTISGWTQLDATTINSAACAAGVFYRVATSTDASTRPTYDFPIGGTHKAIGIMAAFNNVDTNNPFNQHTTATTTSGSTTQTFSSVTPTVFDDMLVGFGVFRNGSNGLTNNNFTPPSGWTERADIQTTATSSNNAEAIFMTQSQVNPAAPSNLAGTLVNSSTGIMFTMALTPQPSPDTGTGTEAVSLIGLSTSETGSFAEAAFLTTSFSGTDTGHGTEGTPTIVVPVSGTDTGTGTENAPSFAKSDADFGGDQVGGYGGGDFGGGTFGTGVANETESIFSNTTSADTGTGTDNQPARSHYTSIVGTPNSAPSYLVPGFAANDFIAINGVPVSDTDSNNSVTEFGSASGNSVSQADSGSFTEAAFISISSADTGTFSEVVIASGAPITSVSDFDRNNPSDSYITGETYGASGFGSGAFGGGVTIPVEQVVGIGLTASDTGHAAESASAPDVIDSAHGTEGNTVKGTYGAIDKINVAENAVVVRSDSASLTGSDTGTFAESASVVVVNGITSSDSGHGTDSQTPPGTVNNTSGMEIGNFVEAWNVIEVKAPPPPFTQPTIGWRYQRAMSTARAFAASCNVRNKMIVMGGVGAENSYQRNEIFDPYLQVWTTGADVPNPRAYSSCANIHGKVYLIGGLANNSSPVTATDIYDPLNNTWSIGPVGPQIYGHSAVAHQDKEAIYIFGGVLPGTHTGTGSSVVRNIVWPIKRPLRGGPGGGYRSDTTLTTVFKFDGTTYTSAGNLAVNMSFHGAARVGDYFYMAGGNGGLSGTGQAQYWNIANQSGTLTPNVNIDSYITASAIGNVVYFMGGGHFASGSITSSRQTWAYDTLLGAWYRSGDFEEFRTGAVSTTIDLGSRPAMAFPRITQYSSAEVSNDLIYLFGGEELSSFGGLNTYVASNAMQIYNAKAHSMQNLNMPVAIDNIASTVVNNSIYISGRTGLSSVFLEFKPGMNTYTVLPSIGANATGGGMAAVGNNIYFVAYGALHVKIFDTIAQSWSTAASTVPFSTPNALSAVSLGTNVYIIADSRVWKYDTVGDIWTSMNAVQLTDPQFRCTITQNTIVAISGTLGEHWEFDIPTQDWRFVRELNSFRTHSTPVYDDAGDLYVVGGFTEPEQPGATTPSTVDAANNEVFATEPALFLAGGATADENNFGTIVYSNTVEASGGITINDPLTRVSTAFGFPGGSYFVDDLENLILCYV